MRELVFVVDMINGFCKEGALADPHIMGIVDEIRKTLGAKENGDVWFVADTHAPDAVEFEVFPPHCLAGTYESEVIDELKEFVSEDRMIRKNSVNTFLAMERPQDVFTDDVSEVLITGCCTDICIQNFANTLKQYCNQANKRITVKVDMKQVDTFDSPVHPRDAYQASAVSQMEACGVVVYNK